MFGRRRGREDATPETPDAAVEEVQPDQAEEAAAPSASSEIDRSGGPFDIDEVENLDGHVDLGSVLMPLTEGLELRLHVDDDSGEVAAIVMVGEDGLLETRPFAAARNGDLWTQARSEIAEDIVNRGGQVEEIEGPFGVELACLLPLTGPDGEPAVQPSRVIGITGPRWFVRATIAGRPGLPGEDSGIYEAAIRSMVVRRGSSPMAPGDPLPLSVPEQARRLD